MALGERMVSVVSMAFSGTVGAFEVFNDVECINDFC